MQEKPTQEQVMRAFAVIENADPDDVMALTVTSLTFAERHGKLAEVATNLEVEAGGAYDVVQRAFDPFN